MRNRELHDALREFALEAAALLSDEQKAGAELEFDVEDEGGRRGPSLYRYRPLTERFIAERWPQLRSLPTCGPAAAALGAGAAGWLRVQGLRGEQAEPALHAMLDRLYEDSTSFGFPEERFERVYAEVERTLYEGTLPTTIVAPVPGLELEGAPVDLGDGLSLVPGARVDAPCDHDGPLCMLERDVAPDDPLPGVEARERFRTLATALRLLKPGGVTVAAVGWRRAAEGRWTPLELEPVGAARGEPLMLAESEGPELRELLEALEGSPPQGAAAWALARFEMGCSRQLEAEALSDYLLALRALLDTATDSGRASLALRLAALCAEEGERRAVQPRVELALTLEGWLMAGGRERDELGERLGHESPRALVAQMEAHLRALLRDVICGYLTGDLRSLADEMLLDRAEPEPAPEPFEIEARDLRREKAPPATVSAKRAEADTNEVEALGVTPSMDWDDPEGFSAPV